jgi:hypothetical protein
MKPIIATLFLSMIFFNVESQITKGYWLLSGNASVSSSKNSSAASIQFKQTDIQVGTNVGHFIIDKLAVGLRPLFSYGSNNVGNSSSVFGIGPFVRYYILKPESIVNLLSDASYSYEVISGGQKSNTITLFAGPVVYFNSSVGIEFLLGYSTTKIVGFDGRNNKVQFGVGFQFHLEKEK